MMFDRFLEYGEYKGNMYGTSIESVKDVLNSGKICVVDIEPNVNKAQRERFPLKAKTQALKAPVDSQEELFFQTYIYPFNDINILCKSKVTSFF